MRPIIIHAGFHKTGTTTAQRFLMENGAHIWPSYAIATQHRIKEPLKMALAYSTGAGQLALDEFRFQLTDFLKTLNLGANRGLIMSDENLAGMMPGKNDLVDGYTSCPALMQVVAQCVEDVINPNPNLTFYFSTREPTTWLRSIWWHNLSKTRLTEGLEDFSSKLGPTCDLDETVRQVQAAVGPYQVVSSRLEQVADQAFGPAAPLIDLLELHSENRRALRTIPAENVMPSLDLANTFLALNRSELSNSQLTAHKKKLLAAAKNK